MDRRLTERDKAVLWHPFTQMQTAPSPIPIVRGKGAWLYAADGKRYFDGISSWWVNLHGHCHPYIQKRLRKQLGRLEHVMFAGFTHRPAVEAAEKLLEILPYGFKKVFFSDNGSTAVETALKMVFQYWYNLEGSSCKRTLVAFAEGYHGDTFGAMSASGSAVFNRPFHPFLFHVETITPPYAGSEERSLQQLNRLLETGAIAGFIFEPVVQGVNGMKSHSIKGLDALIRRCNEKGVLTIADEVMTGFGRLGPLFASTWLQNSPDIICLSKGLTGGFLPLAATVVKEEVYDAFLSDEKCKALLHGHTYTANPLACAAASANIDLLQQERCLVQRQEIEQSHRLFQKRVEGHPKLKRCEVIGTILALEYAECQQEEDPIYFSTLTDLLLRFFLNNGVVLRPMGNCLHLMPPYCASMKALQRVYQLIEITLGENTWMDLSPLNSSLGNFWERSSKIPIGIAAGSTRFPI